MASKKNKIKTVKYLAHEKKSKKEQKAENDRQRGVWTINPITRVVPNKGKNAYDRRAVKRELRTAW